MENKKSKAVQWVAIAVILVSVATSGYIFYGDYFSKASQAPVNQDPNNQNNNNNQPGTTAKPSVDDDAVLGDTSAPVTIIEFSDFQCPFCRSFWRDAFVQIKKEYIDTGKVKFVYRDFPLTSIHPGAMPSAEGAECAKEQGKFWEMHDRIFEEQEKKGQGSVAFTAEDVKAWAGAIGVNASQFNACLDSGKYKAEVQKDMADGQAAGVTGTPAFFVGKSTSDGVIDGVFISGARPFTSFKVEIDKLLSQ